MSKLKSVESVAWIVGLLIIAQSVYKGFKVPDYDPVPNVLSAMSIILGARIAPTDRIDQKINDVLPDKDVKDLLP